LLGLAALLSEPWFILPLPASDRLRWDHRRRESAAHEGCWWRSRSPGCATGVDAGRGQDGGHGHARPTPSADPFGAGPAGAGCLA